MLNYLTAVSISINFSNNSLGFQRQYFWMLAIVMPIISAFYLIEFLNTTKAELNHGGDSSYLSILLSLLFVLFVCSSFASVMSYHYVFAYFSDFDATLRKCIRKFLLFPKSL